VVQVFEKCPAEGCLAGTNLAGDFHKAIPLDDCIGQMGEDLFVAFTQKEIGRIRNKFKRSFIETKEVFVHLIGPPWDLHHRQLINVLEILQFIESKGIFYAYTFNSEME